MHELIIVCEVKPQAESSIIESSHQTGRFTEAKLHTDYFNQLCLKEYEAPFGHVRLGH